MSLAAQFCTDWSILSICFGWSYNKESNFDVPKAWIMVLVVSTVRKLRIFEILCRWKKIVLQVAVMWDKNERDFSKTTPMFLAVAEHSTGSFELTRALMRGLGRYEEKITIMSVLLLFIRYSTTNNMLFCLTFSCFLIDPLNSGAEKKL